MPMFRARRPFWSPAMAVALIALFVALGGVSFAAAKIGAGGIASNAIRSKHIKAGAVQMQDLAPVKKFRVSGATSSKRVLRLAGLELYYECTTGYGLHETRVRATTTVAHSRLVG